MFTAFACGLENDYFGMPKQSCESQTAPGVEGDMTAANSATEKPFSSSENKAFAKYGA